MKIRKYMIVCGVLTAFVAGGPANAAPNISQFTSSPIKTLQLNVNVVQDNQDQLAKIGGDFGTTYRFRKLAFSYEQPGKLHYEALIMGARVDYTISGNSKFISIPGAHIHKVENIAGQPGKKQTLLDSGLIPPELLNEYNVTFLRHDGKQLVYQIQSKIPSETAKEIVWIDPVTHVTTRRMHFNRAGKLESWFTYTQPVEIAPHIYVPTKVDVYNSSNELAAVTSYTDIRVNRYLSPSLFTF